MDNTELFKALRNLGIAYSHTGVGHTAKRAADTIERLTRALADMTAERDAEKIRADKAEAEKDAAVVIKKYSWTFEEDAEMWCGGTCETVEQCIAEATEESDNAAYYPEERPNVVYIGENNEYIPCVDADSVLDLLEEQASDFAGLLGDEWQAYNPKKRDELDELSAALSEVVIAWMKKYGYEPNFCQVSNVKEYPLPTKEEQSDE